MDTPSSHEMRQDRITKQWVACAPHRSMRPQRTGSVERDSANTSSSNCPFCPGHEGLLPRVLWQLDDPEGSLWRTRAVPNKFPALTPDAPPCGETHELYQCRASYGHQEVLIDTPHHRQSLPDMPVAQVDAMLETYLARYRTVRTGDPSLIPFLFRNHGTSAGASVDHPHSQLIATDFAPPQIKREEQEAHARYRETGRCPYCQLLETELETDVRVVESSEQFLLFVPYAARVPFELWILPRQHNPEFGHLPDNQRRNLAGLLRSAVSRLHDRLQDPDYNFFVRTALQYETSSPYLHWSLRIQPRTTMNAGFELSTGLRINPSTPERDAAELRAAG